MNRAFIQPSILWHLHNEGTATLSDLARLVGSPQPSIYNVLVPMRVLGQVMCPAPVAGDDPQRLIYSLTRDGIEAAMRVESHQVEFA